MRNVSQTKAVEKMKTNGAVYDNVEKYCRVGQATCDNMAHCWIP
jgi:hypothetical protein